MRPPLLPNHPRSPAGGQVKMNIMSEELAGATRDKTISNKPSEEWLFSFLLFYNKGKHSRNGKMSYLCKSNPEESGMQITQQNLITLAHKSNHHKPHLLQSKKTLYSTSYDIIYDTLSEFKLSNKHTFHCKFVEPRHDNFWGDVDTITWIRYIFIIFVWVVWMVYMSSSADCAFRFALILSTSSCKRALGVSTLNLYMHVHLTFHEWQKRSWIRNDWTFF